MNTRWLKKPFVRAWGKNMKKKEIHFLGIKGVGMAPLAIIAKQSGFSVSGCDIGQEFITDISLKNAGLIPVVGFSKDHLKDIDLLITTTAHEGLKNPEVLEAKERKIEVLLQGEAVGVFMDGQIFDRKFEGISIAGCHGKTTTTAMIATIFKESGLDPSFTVGTGDVPSLSSCGHFGKGKYFIAEADEYDRKFLWQHPKIAIFNNIEFDHPDTYESIDEVRLAFLRFAKNLPQDGVLVANGDDFEVRKLIKEYPNKVLTFGKSPTNDFILKNVNISGSRTFFWVETKEKNSLGEFSLNLAGEHNALNALAAIVVSLECGISIEKIKKGLTNFIGTKRRFEYIGKLPSGALLFDDYAHHPTEIKKTLEAFRQRFPKSNIICIFQPHMYSRTKILFEQFSHSFSDANQVIITNIYPSQREEIDPNFSSRFLAEAIGNIQKDILFLPELQNVVEYVAQNKYPEDSVIITMGAGDIYRVAEKLGLEK